MINLTSRVIRRRKPLVYLVLSLEQLTQRQTGIVSNALLLTKYRLPDHVKLAVTR